MEPRERRYVTQFQDALAGAVPGKHDCEWLTREDVARAVLEVPFPQLLGHREAKIRAVTWVDSPSGRSEVWARAFKHHVAATTDKSPAAKAAFKPTTEQLHRARKCVAAPCDDARMPLCLSLVYTA